MRHIQAKEYLPMAYYYNLDRLRTKLLLTNPVNREYSRQTAENEEMGQKALEEAAQHKKKSSSNHNHNA